MQLEFTYDNGVLRQYEIKGTSNIVPKIRVNYTDIGYLASVSKEDLKHGCDIVIRDLRDKVKSGQSTQLMIPNVKRSVKTNANTSMMTNVIKNAMINVMTNAITNVHTNSTVLSTMYFYFSLILYDAFYLFVLDV